MRLLATIAFSFSGAVLLSVLLPFGGWELWCAAALVPVGLLFLRWRERKWARFVTVIALSAAVGLCYCVGYDAVRCAPVRQRCDGEVKPFAATVCDWPQETAYGAKVTVVLEGQRGVKAVYYGDSDALSLRPGNRIAGEARWQDAGRIQDSDVTTFTARGVFVLLYGKGTIAVSPGSEGSFRWWPQRVGRYLKETVARVWGDPTVAGLITGMLTGDKSGIDQADYATMRETGMAHLFAVSGLHCGFLVMLLQLVPLPRRLRFLGNGLTILVLLFYMCMVGLTPSVVRACVMQIFFLLGTIIRKDDDPLTSLAAALLVILLCNPYAAASVSLQLSFGAMLGLLKITPRLYDVILPPKRGAKSRLYRIKAFFVGNFCSVVGATVFTAPLTALYFGMLSVVSPLSGVVAVPLAGYGFGAAFASAVLGMLWLPLGQLAGKIAAFLMLGILTFGRLLQKIPYHAVYFTGRLLWVWLAYVYALFIGCTLTKEGRRKYVAATALALVSLAAVVLLTALDSRRGDMNVTVLDVGQGESVALASGGAAAVMDCGSSNSFIRAGEVAAQQLESMGIRRLDAVIVSHFHADHTNGLETLLQRVPVETLYLPDIEDDYGVRERLEALAEAKGIGVVWVKEWQRLPFGEGTLTIFPPVGVGDMNEQGLSLLASAGSFDTLITGDMAGATERALAEKYDLPDVEVLVVSHHGSAGSSDADFLAAISPETAVISVGKNDYGHPSSQAMLRLAAAGAEIYRTDINGAVRIRAERGEP